LTDTVGFIRKLPHHLVEAFKATLEEVNEADLLLHVIDASQPRVAEQIAAVEAVLRELGAQDKPTLAVFNKTDLERGRNQAIQLADRFSHSASISAMTGEGIRTLCQTVADLLRDRMAHLRLKIPAGEGRWIAALHANGKILDQKVSGKHLMIEAVVSSAFAATLNPGWMIDR
jgi:GTPase